MEKTQFNDIMHLATVQTDRVAARDTAAVILALGLAATQSLDICSRAARQTSIHYEIGARTRQKESQSERERAKQRQRDPHYGISYI